MRNVDEELFKLMGDDIDLKKTFILNEAILMCYKDGIKTEVMAHALGLTSKEILEIIKDQKKWHNYKKLINLFDSVLEDRKKERKKKSRKTKAQQPPQ